MLKFAIIGAGAGGQSMAAILTSKGYIAKLYDIDKEKIHRLQELKTIKVTGVIACEAAPAVITDRIDEVMDDVDVKTRKHTYSGYALVDLSLIHI